jgi:hypothetical protein
MTRSDDPIVGGDPDAERTDPESPTGLRRSLAAQLEARDRALQCATTARLELQNVTAALAATTIARNRLRRQLVLTHMANTALVITIVAMAAAMLAARC